MNTCAQKLGGFRAVLLAVVFVMAEMPQLFGFPLTAPAFLWSPQPYGLCYDNNKFVEYRTVFPMDLVKSVLSQGGWSNFVCSQKNLDKKMDVAVVFVGRKLQSSDISSTKQPDPSLINTLKLSFTTSNFSLAFPYVAIDEWESLESSLINGFAERCGERLGVNRIAQLGSCSVNGRNLEKLQGLHSINDFLASRIGGKTDLIVLCSGGSEEPGKFKSEGKVLSETVNLLKQSGAKYTVLYASNPHTSQHPSHLAMRVLADSTQSNAPSNSTCDGVCQIKSSLLEGIFVVCVVWLELTHRRDLRHPKNPEKDIPERVDDADGPTWSVLTHRYIYIFA